MMKVPFTRSKAGLRALLLSGLMFSTAAALAGPPSQLPLLSRDASGPIPNLMVTLDDSGSMRRSHMPSSMQYNLVDGSSPFQTMGFHPAEAAYVQFSKSRFVTARDTDLGAARMRSSGVNTIYYDPEVLYLPWSNGDGTNMPDSDPAAALVNPMNAADGTINLMGVQTITGNWCSVLDPAAPAYTCVDSDETMAPATYFIFDGVDETDIASFTRVQISDATTFVRTSARADCAADIVDPTVSICSQAEEYQNFANWYSYYRTRMFMAVGGIGHAFAPLGESMRVGFGSINSANNDIDGVVTDIIDRGVRSFAGTDRIAFFDFLNNWAVDGPNSGTPLRYAMDVVGKYFERSDDDGPWGSAPGESDSTAHLECRKSYHILMTDGGWNSAPATGAADSNVDNQTGPVISGPGVADYQYVPSAPWQDANPSMLADVAMYYWNRDLRPDLENNVNADPENPAFWQNLVQFTIGLGVNGDLNPETDLQGLQDGSLTWSTNTLDDLWHAAVNSRGQYLSASDPATVTTKLGETLNDIATRESSEAGVSVSSAVLEAGNRKYTPGYRTNEWSGDVIATGIDAQGFSTGVIWRASDELPDHTLRQIYVGEGLSTGTTEFKWASMSASLQAQLGPTADEAMVEYLRGDRTYEGSAFRTRSADSLLGDVINSTPALIGGLLDEQYQFLPEDAGERATYRAFLEQKKGRDPVLFVGANDGMLHAFDGETGVEKFAFIPNAALDNMAQLSDMSYSHKMFVDGPLNEADAFLSGSWRNILVGSMGAGGKSIFALDVTDTANLDGGSVMWEFAHAELGNVLSPIAVGKMKDDSWAAVFGNGVDSASGNARLYIVDLQTGILKKTIVVPGADNGLGGVRLVKDINNVIVAAYAGDLLGRMWRFDLESNSTADWAVGFGGTPLFEAEPTQAALATPEYILHPNGGQLVIFGTGRLFEETDPATTDMQSLYGVWDQVDGSEVSASGLEVTPAENLQTQTFGAVFGTEGAQFSQSSSAVVDYDSQRGWKLDLSLVAGLRNVYPTQLVRGFAFFSTVAPAGEAHACNALGATGYGILVSALFGANSSKQVLDTNGDGNIDEGDQLVSAFETRADGVNRILTGREGAVSIQGSTHKNGVLPGRDLERIWRQIMNPPS